MKHKNGFTITRCLCDESLISFDTEADDNIRNHFDLENGYSIVDFEQEEFECPKCGRIFSRKLPSWESEIVISNPVYSFSIEPCETDDTE